MENKALNAEIISVGTELLLGHTTNTDARDISLMLSEIGINVKYHTVVGDNPQRLADCIEIAKRRADIIISTGGLGPTCDDLTKMILAQSFGLELEMNEDERACLYDYLTNKGYSKTMTENNLSRMGGDFWGTPAAPSPETMAPMRHRAHRATARNLKIT